MPSRTPIEALQSLLDSLLAQIPEDSSPRVITVKPDLPAPSPLRPNGSKARTQGSQYDPSLVFALELATIVALRDAETVEKLGKSVADALQTVLRDNNVHPVVLSRTVYYLLKLLRGSNDHDYIRAPVILHNFATFDQEVLKQTAPTLLKGLLDCMNGPVSLRNELVNSPDFWTLLRTLHALPEVAADVFRVAESLINANPSGICADNYEAAIALLNDFATAGSAGAIEEQRGDAERRRGKGVKPKKTQYVLTRISNATETNLLQD